MGMRNEIKGRDENKEGFPILSLPCPIDLRMAQV